MVKKLKEFVFREDNSNTLIIDLGEELHLH